MQNTYNPIAEQILKLENAKRSNLFLSEMGVNDDKFDDHGFLKVFEVLKAKFEVTYTLIGDVNFKTLVFEYIKTNPVQSANSQKYGQSFPQFLGQLPQMRPFYFVKYLAMLDWFWFITDNPKATIQLPKGTLNSWGNIARGEDAINVVIDETQIETLSVQKKGKEYTIIAK